MWRSCTLAKQIELVFGVSVTTDGRYFALDRGSGSTHRKENLTGRWSVKLLKFSPGGYLFTVLNSDLHLVMIAEFLLQPQQQRQTVISYAWFQRWRVCFVQFARWRHRGEVYSLWLCDIGLMPSPTLSGGEGIKIHSADILSPVHTSNKVEATLSNATMSNVASTLLPVWTGL